MSAFSSFATIASDRSSVSAFLSLSSECLSLCFCRVLTPYYTEEVLFSLRELEEPNEDGVSIVFYLQKIFPGLFSLPNSH